MCFNVSAFTSGLVCQENILYSRRIITRQIIFEITGWKCICKCHIIETFKYQNIKFVFVNISNATSDEDWNEVSSFFLIQFIILHFDFTWKIPFVEQNKSLLPWVRLRLPDVDYMDYDTKL